MTASLSLPPNLPVPEDDSACDHLAGFTLSSPLFMTSTSPISPQIDIAALPGLVVIFCFPRTAEPNEVVPPEWDAIPGARGCTPQACSFRDNFSRLKDLKVTHVYGLSTQSKGQLEELATRLHLPYDLLVDEDLKFQQALGLPTFDWKERKLLKRVTLAIEQGKVVKYWYPVFPPDKGVESVLEWLGSRSK
ncbi:hypothetical protein FQN57_000601 [Myotisia sp. PD_48]|nr:hypothetical protein FQN57_000601 [Myotisia sp. PD_48]